MQRLQSLKLCLGLVLILVSLTFSQTGFPLVINYSGTLTGEEAGKSNTVNIKFSLYENSTISLPIWQEEHEDVVVSNGIFNVDLGTVVAFGNSVPFNKQYWLGVVYDGMSEFRIKLTASPYALTANTVSGKILEGVAIENNLLVKSINGLTDNITFKEGTDISIAKEGNEIIFSYTGTGGGIGATDTNVVTTSHLIDSIITTSKLSDGAVTSGKLEDGSVTTSKIASGGNDKLLATDAAGIVGWVDKTSIAGSGGGISPTDTGAVKSENLDTNSVTSDKIADNAVTAAEVATDAIGADEIATGAVGSDEIAADAVTASEIATNAVGADEIATGAVGSDEIAADAVTASEIATNAVGADEIATNAVGSDEIAADAVTASEIATNAVGADEIATNAVGSDEIAADAVTASEIATNAVGSDEIATDAVGSDEIAADAVTASEIATNAVGSDEIATGAVDTDELAADAVDGTKISLTGELTGNTMVFDGTNWVSSTNLTVSGGHVHVSDGANVGTLEIHEASGDGTNTVSVAAQAMAADYTLTLPADAGTAGYLLRTDGSGGLTWMNPAGGGGHSVAGSGMTQNVTVMDLGGTMTTAATITAAAFDFTVDLTGTGDFYVKDGGTTHLSITDAGVATFGNTLDVTGAVTLNDAITLGDAAADVITVTGTVAGATPLVLEGATPNGFETSLAVTDPTGARTITLPDATGTVALTTDITGGTQAGSFSTLAASGTTTLDGGVIMGDAATDAITVVGEVRGANPFHFEGISDNNTYTTFAITDPTVARTVTFKDESGTVAYISDLSGGAGSFTTLDASGATTLDGAVTLGDAATDVITVTGEIAGASPLVFEGVTANDVYTTIAITDPTGARTITLPDATGTVALTSDITAGGNSGTFVNLTSTGSTTLGDAGTDAVTVTGEVMGANPFHFEGATDDGTYTTFAITDPTVARTVTFKNESGTVAYISDLSGGAGSFTTLDASGATTLDGAVTLGDAATDVITVTGEIAGASPLVFEGVTANDVYTTLAIADPTGARTITLPDATGTVALTSDIGPLIGAGSEDGSFTTLDASGATGLDGAVTLGDAATDAITVTGEVMGASPLHFEGASDNDVYTTIAVTDPTGARIITLPDASGTVAFTSDIGPLIGAGSEDGSFTTLDASGTTTLDGAVILGDAATDVITVTGEIAGASPLVFEGATTDNVYTTFAITDPTVARTVTFKNESGTVAYLSDLSGGAGSFTTLDASGATGLDGAVTLGDAATDAITVTGEIMGASPLHFEGVTDNDTYTTLAITDPTGARIITIPDASGTVAFTSDIGPLIGAGSEDGSFTTLDASGTTTLDGAVILGDAATDVITVTGEIAGASPLVFEGVTANNVYTTFDITDPTGARTVTFKDASGSVAFVSDITGGTEAGSFTTVTASGAATATGNIQSGTNGTDGALKIWAEQATDRMYTIAPHAAATQDVTLTLPADDGANGELLQTDGSGNLSWIAGAGGESTTAANGLNESGTEVRLGGPLTVASTTITQDGTEELKFSNTGTGKTIIDLTSSGNFEVQDGSSAVLTVAGTGGATTISSLNTTGAATFDGAITLGDASTDVITVTGEIAGASPLVFEGATANDVYTTFAITDPTGARIVTFKNESGTVAYLSDLSGGTGSFTTLDASGATTLDGAVTLGDAATDAITVTGEIMGASPLHFEGVTDNDTYTTLAITDPTGARIITIPDASGTVAFTSDIGPLIGAGSEDGSFTTLDASGATTLDGAVTLGDAATDAITVTGEIMGASPLHFEGVTDNDTYTTLAITDPTGARIITIPDASGTVAFTSDIGPLIGAGSEDGSFTTLDASGTTTLDGAVILGDAATDVITVTGEIAGASPLVFEGVTANNVYTTFDITDPTGARTVTFKDASGSVAFVSDITGGTEAGSFTTVTASGAATATGNIQSGTNGTDGALKIWAEQATDRMYTIQPHAAATQDVVLTLPADDGGAGELLQTDGAGNLTWVAGAGGEATAAGSGTSLDGVQVDLGGTLDKTTTITAATYDFTFDLNNTGDFYVKDGGTTHLSITDAGVATFGSSLDVTGAASLDGAVTLGDAATDVVTVTGEIAGASPLVFEGSSTDNVYTTFAITDPTIARTITFPNATGTVALTSDISNAYIANAGTTNLTASTEVIQTAAEEFKITNAGTANALVNLTSTGDFHVQVNGSTAFYVNDGGTTRVTGLLQLANGSSTGGRVQFYEDSDNGTDFLTITAPSSIAALRSVSLQDADGTLSLVTDITGGSRAGSFTTLDASGATTLDGAVTLGDAVADIVTVTGTVAGASPLVFEGATADAFEATFAIVDPTVDRTITFKNESGTVALLSDLGGGNFIASDGATALTANIAVTQDGTEELKFSNTGSGKTIVDLTTSGNFEVQDDGTAVLTILGTGGTTNITNLTAPTFASTTAGITTLTVSTTANLNGATNIGNGATDVITIAGEIAGGSPLVFEGATANDVYTTFVITDPTGARTVTFKDESGSVALVSDITGGTEAGAFTTLAVSNGATTAGSIDFYEDTDNGASKATVIAPALAGDITLTLPGTSGTIPLTTDISGGGLAGSFTTLAASGVSTLTGNVNIGAANLTINTNKFVVTGATGNTDIAGTLTVDEAVTLGDAAADIITVTGTVAGASPLVFEGATADAFEATFAIVDPTVDRTITFKNESGTVALLSDLGGGSFIASDGATALSANIAITQDGSEELKFSNTGTGKTIIDLTSSGAFEVQDGGAAALSVDGAGLTSVNATLSVKSLTGTQGIIRLYENIALAGDNYATFTVGAMTSNPTLTIPEQNGTLAITGDITGGTLAGSFTTLTTSGAGGIGSTLDIGGLTSANGGLAVKNGATTAGFVNFFEDTDDGASKATMITPALGGDITLTLPNATGTIALTSDISGNFLATDGNSTMTANSTIDLATFDMIFDVSTSGTWEVKKGGTSYLSINNGGALTAPNVTLTGGTVNNIAIGNATPSTASFTTTETDILYIDNAAAAATILMDEGTTAGGNRITFTTPDIAGDITVTMPSIAGTIALTSDISNAYIANTGTTNLTASTEIIQSDAEEFKITNNSTAHTIVDLTSTGDFRVELNGSPKFWVNDGGSTRVNGMLQLNRGTTSAGAIQFYEDEDNGTDILQVAAPASLSAGTTVVTFQDAAGTVALTADITGGTRAGSFTTLATSGNMTFGNATTDEITMNAKIRGDATDGNVVIQLGP